MKPQSFGWIFSTEANVDSVQEHKIESSFRRGSPSLYPERLFKIVYALVDDVSRDDLFSSPWLFVWRRLIRLSFVFTDLSYPFLSLFV